MKLSFTPFAAVLLFASVANAQSISASSTQSVVGCADGESVTFQATPCPDGSATIPTAIPVSAPATPAQTTAQSDNETTAAAPIRKAPRYRYAIHTNHDQLRAGMSDLQVLNNRRWGKPQHISRTRDNRAWHEYWDYKTGANGGKQLHFINGVLADIEELEPLVKPIRIATATMADGQ